MTDIHFTYSLSLANQQANFAMSNDNKHRPLNHCSSVALPVEVSPPLKQ